MRKSNLLLGGLFLVILFVFSCKSKRFYDNVYDIQKGEWQKNQVVKFDVPVMDTIHGYNLFFEIRNSNVYPYSNLFLFVTTTSPNRAIKKDTIEITLADERGKWLGNGLGGIRSNEIMFKNNIRFPVPGFYKVEVAHGMRDDVLKGIIDVGLKIDRN
jgi:gliding motility-associated lipoprotein GldH